MLSSGSIQLALSVLSVLVFLLLLLSSLKREKEGAGFRLNFLDLFYSASVVVALASFLASSRARENFLQPHMAVTAFGVYLLVRMNRRRLGGRTAVRLAGALAALAGLVAVHGLAQLAVGREMRGFFFNVNHFAVFLAMAAPAAWAAARAARSGFLRVSGYGFVALVLAAVGLSRCRTSYAAILLVAGFTLLGARLGRRTASVGPETRPRASAVRGALLFGAAVLAVVAALAVSFKPLSAAGRVLIWKVGLRTALSHPVAGIGYGNFPAVYGREQGRYFEEGRGTPTERLSADSRPYAFNDYLESFMETGFAGLLVLLPLWSLILMTVGRALHRPELTPPGRPLDPEKILMSGAAGSVLAYMVISVSYYPGRILPLALLFAGLLGWIADDGRAVPAKAVGAGRTYAAVFAAAALIAALALFPTAWKRYGAERVWSKAIGHDRAGRTGEAAALSRAAYPRLKHNADFIDFHAGVMLKAGEAAEAAVVLEKAKEFSSNPRLSEKLAAARLELGRLDGALESGREAAAALPWRLTSKSILTDIHMRRGDFEEALRCARLVLETPMKIRTEEGEALKAKAFDTWERCGPGPGGFGSPLLDTVAGLPAEYRGGALGALQAMGAGRAARFLEAIRGEDAEGRADLSFLLANMPDRDVFGIDVDDLAENVRLARLARRTVPLAANVPDEIFLEYVLPYAAADERREPWRRDFYERFREAAAASPSVEEALVRLNRDVFMTFRLGFFERDSRRPPLSTSQSVESGLVSCAEAAVMLVYACRAAGLPARMVILRRWPRFNFGHVWIEIWEKGRWIHLSAYDPAQPGQTWIRSMAWRELPPGSRGFIFAVRFKRNGIPQLAGRDVNAEDVTERYLKK